MSHQKTINVFISIAIFLGTIGCTNSNDSFSEAIKKARNTTLPFIPKIKDGLPYFIKTTLTPTWDTSDKEKIVALPQFNLIDQNSKPFTKESFLNKTTVVGFIFTSCAGFCPTLISKLKEVEREIKDLNNVQIVVFSVDPDVDTPEVLATYAKKHHINNKSHWHLVTGNKQEIYSLIRDTFASEVKKLESNNMRKFAHTEHFYVLDQNTHLRKILNGTRIDMPKTAATTVALLKK